MKRRMFNYTKEQEMGIKMRGRDMLISAAAGSGKTRVLVDRIVDMVVSDGISLKNMLVVTFTRAAAGEMRARLEKALQEAIVTYPDKSEFIQKELYQLSECHISTMHAFCINILREYFYLLDLSPKFGLLSSSEEAVLKNEALDQVLSQAYEAEDEAFLDFVRAYGGHRSDKKLIDMIFDLTNFLSGIVDGDTWLENALKVYQNPSEEDTFFHFLVKTSQLQIDRLEDSLKAMGICLNDTLPLEATQAHLKTLLLDQEVIEMLKKALNQDIKTYLDALSKVSFSRLATAPKAYKEMYSHVYQSFKNLRDNELKKGVKDLQDLVKDLDVEKIREDRKILYPYFLTLLRLTNEYQATYALLKKEENMLDFSDIEHLMLKLLKDDKVKKSIKERICYIFFDEYQDANPIQEAIVSALQGENNLFFVGDVKQAIYRFRLSDPSIFNARYKAYRENQDLGALIFLSKNFRSEPMILNFANFIFSNLMMEDLGEVDYTEEGQALIAGKEEGEEKIPITLHLVEKDEESEYDEEVIEIAKTIGQMHQKGYAYRDIAILLRSPRAKLKVFEEVFKQAEIPYFTDNSTVSFENVEVKRFLEVLKCIANASQDETLIATLLSPFGGFDELDVAKVRVGAPDSSFYGAMVYFSDELALGKRLLAFQDKLSHWQRIFRDLPLVEAGSYLLEESGYGAYLLASSNGQARYENVKAFVGLMEEYDGFSHLGLTGFLAYADTLVKEKADTLSPAMTLSEADDCVRIMSIHKSKGLEFPVVFLADTAKGFNFKESSSSLVLESKLGMAMNVVDLETKTYHKSFEKRILATYQRALTKSEEVRLLYVALTRPIKELHWFGKVSDKEKALTNALDKSTLFGLYQANSYLEWLLLILAKDKVGKIVFSGDNDLPKSDYFSGEKVLCLAEDDVELSESKEKLVAALRYEDALEKDITAKLYYHYPYQEETRKPAKRTVSDLKKDSYQVYLNEFQVSAHVSTKKEKEIIPPPKFLLNEQALSPAQKGTLFHKVMALLPLEVLDEASLETHLENLVNKNFITVEEKTTLPIKRILAFYASPLAGRIIVAESKDLVRREASFTMLYENSGVDGQIDLFFEEEGQLILLDFKTDRRININIYKKQMELYKMALEEAFQKPVKEVWLYWLSHDKATLL